MCCRPRQQSFLMIETNHRQSERDQLMWCPSIPFDQTVGKVCHLENCFCVRDDDRCDVTRNSDDSDDSDDVAAASIVAELLQAPVAALVHLVRLARGRAAVSRSAGRRRHGRVLQARRRLSDAGRAELLRTGESGERLSLFARQLTGCCCQSMVLNSLGVDPQRNWKGAWRWCALGRSPTAAR